METSEAEELRREVDGLRKTVEELRTELGVVRGRVDLTMRGQMRCPACGGRRILEVPTLLDKASYGPEEMTLLGKYSVIGGPWKKTQGVFGAFLCGSCGKVELYIKDAADIEPDGEKILLVGTGEEEDRSPYR